MTRSDFLRQLGLGAAFALTVPCLHSCGGGDDGEGEVPSAPDASFTLDLADPANAALHTDGGYVVKNSVVVARTVDGGYAAATVICSHEGNRQVTYSTVFDEGGEWYCTAHGARFATATGDGKNADAAKGLRIYPVTVVDADTLNIG